MQQRDSIRKIKGIGEQAEKKFHKLNIETVGDLLEHYPREYDVFRPVCKISMLEEGEVAAIEGYLKGSPSMKRVRQLKILSVVIEDGSGRIQVTWFNMPYLISRLRMGSSYILRGKVTRKNGVLVMEQPKLYTKEEFLKHQGKMLPVYPLTAGLTNHTVSKAMEQAIKETEDISEFLPPDIRKGCQLIPLKKAVSDIHFPKNAVDYKKARKRLVFDELFLYNLALQNIKKEGIKESKYSLVMRDEVIHLEESLPFTLTPAQQKVYEDILSDMMSGHVMNRLVQGDVGSGKTIIAVLTLYLTVLNGYQGAFMVPTEVLAKQHEASLTKLLSPLGVKVELLVGSMTAKEKREAYERIACGKAQIIVGTHAIIQDKVTFEKLALVITDEQHRFGVKQRENLYKKGEEPHVLAMSATPIPRTLALILYGDMDLSVINALPANRLPIKNCVVGTNYRPNAYRFMSEQIRQGHQVYIICPMVEENEEMALENVTIYTERLKEEFPETVRIKSLHGKMRPLEKTEIMQDFSEGKTDILVSTTVIEVGIDVPNATTIMIENAERFGLAQLHQLRGRVGRGSAQSYCILMAGTENKEAKKRLDILASSNDGFYIASEDLKLRGQGDLFGVRQSGDQLFKLADIYEDASVLEMANEAAKQFSLDKFRLLYQKNAKLRRQLSAYMGEVYL